jgi:hypothetical protein
VRPALHAKKIRELELRAGYPEQRGQRGRSYDYNLPHCRREERARAERAEAAYLRMTGGGESEDRGNPRAPQMRCDSDLAARQGLHPHTLLFPRGHP